MRSLRELRAAVEAMYYLILLGVALMFLYYATAVYDLFAGAGFWAFERDLIIGLVTHRLNSYLCDVGSTAERELARRIEAGE